MLGTGRGPPRLDPRATVRASPIAVAPRRRVAGGYIRGTALLTLQHGTLADAARAIVAADLADTQDVTVVRERLQTSWARERWPKRSTRATFEIRDTTHDGGLYRSPGCASARRAAKGWASSLARLAGQVNPDVDWYDELPMGRACRPAGSPKRQPDRGRSRHGPGSSVSAGVPSVQFRAAMPLSDAQGGRDNDRRGDAALRRPRVDGAGARRRREVVHDVRGADVRMRHQLAEDPRGHAGRQAEITYTHRAAAGALREARLTAVPDDWANGRAPRPGGAGA